MYKLEKYLSRSIRRHFIFIELFNLSLFSTENRTFLLCDRVVNPDIQISLRKHNRSSNSFRVNSSMNSENVS